MGSPGSRAPCHDRTDRNPLAPCASMELVSE
jgi:hypothetical protein